MSPFSRIGALLFAAARSPTIVNGVGIARGMPLDAKAIGASPGRPAGR